jgi:hypothetical protein
VDAFRQVSLSVGIAVSEWFVVIKKVEWTPHAPVSVPTSAELQNLKLVEKIDTL